MTVVLHSPLPRIVRGWHWLLMVAALTGCAAGRPLVAPETGPTPGASRPVPAAVQISTAPVSAPADDQVHQMRALGPIDRQGYGMLYFPSAGQGVQLVTDLALNRLFEDALPGYGLYTFVLLGAGLERARGGDLRRHQELFRMIETYVANPEGADGPSPKAHVFLIPVRLDPAPRAPLMDLVAADLSDLMRGRLAEHLRQRGQATLATQIERGAGPFLVTGLEPSLLPLDNERPRLIADLSTLGPEHVYGLVDVYDRDLPPELDLRPRRLSDLRRRLLELSRQSPSASRSGRGAADGMRWIFLI